MGKLNVGYLRYLSAEDLRILTAVEMGMKNHAEVPGTLVVSISNLKSAVVMRRLKDLLQKRLVCFEKGMTYEGYRLTNLGYDFLALKALSVRGSLESLGNQIGMGKESDVYVARDAAGKHLVLKLHRLGRTCFRRLKEKRDYHKHRHTASWIYLSRLSAAKEFSFMQVLHQHGFAVPQPLEHNRHCVLMELVEGVALCHVSQLHDVAAVHSSLMQLIVRLAEHGLIHCDFNEFNVILLENEEAKPVIIDFPQMVSTEHADAQRYFDHDVSCIRDFFKRKFHFESEVLPLFADVNRTASLDVQVRASGYRKPVLPAGTDVDSAANDDDVDSDADTSDDGSLPSSASCSSKGSIGCSANVNVVEVQEEGGNKSDCNVHNWLSASCELQPPVEVEEELRDGEKASRLRQDSDKSSVADSCRTTSTMAPQLIKSRLKREQARKQQRQVQRQIEKRTVAKLSRKLRKQNLQSAKEFEVWEY